MKNILVLENDEEVIHEVISTLNNEAYNLHIAENGSKGYELAIRNHPHLIICNKILFEAEGNEVLYRLRDESFISTIPFIFLIDENSQKKKINSDSKTDFDYYLTKPFTASDISKLVAEAFKRYEVVTKETEKKLNSLRGSISFSLPHEFFTPLNGILGFSDILIRDFDNLKKNEILEMLQYINTDAGRLKKLTENFIAFAQLEIIAQDSSKLNSLKKTYFINPKDIISATSSQVAKEFDREDDLVLELEDAAIRISESYLRKIIGEIANNAFKFSKKNTPVIVTLLSNATSSLISVSDNGHGMTPEQISSIGAYMQFKRKIYEQQGSGLGLIIAKKITELHSGEFSIESRINEYTKVNMIFNNH